jgi:glycosyltransferase involved in cell wall biosynthesis
MHLADANVIPHQSNGHTDNTVPHKLFQGMMAEKPLIVSSCAPLKRYVRNYDCGVVFKAGDEKDFADKVELLYTNKPLQIQLAKNGYDASMRGELNWEATQKTLIDLYTSLN